MTLGRSITNRICLCSLIVTLVSYCDTVAQVPVRFGAIVGYEFGVPLAAARFPGVVNRYGVKGGGISYNHTALIGLAAAFPGLPWPGLTLSVRPGIWFGSGRFTSDPFQSDSLVDSTFRGAEREFSLYSTSSGFALELPVEYGLGSWTFSAGLWGSYRISSGFILSERILAPDTAAYLDGSRNRTLAAGEELAASRFRYGALAAVGLQLQFGDRIRLVPEVRARLDAESLTQGLGVRALNVGAGISILFDPTDRRAASPPDALPPDTGSVRAQPPVRATINLRSVPDAPTSSDTAFLVLDETHYGTLTQLPAEVYFERNDASIPRRYARLDRAEAASFADGDLARLSPWALYHQLLNIVGLRMRANPAARIVLRGSAAPGERPALARARAAVVRDYLCGIWDVAPARVSVEGRAGSSAAAGLEILSNAPAILAPVASAWIVRGWKAPRVALNHAMQAESGVRSWELEIRQAERTVARYRSGAAAIPDHLEGAFAMPVANEAPQPLVAELVVEDRNGQAVVARDTLPIVGVRDPGTGTEQLRYTVLGSERLGEMVASVIGDVRDGARIHVAALSDRNAAGALDPAQVARLLNDRAAERGLRGCSIDTRWDSSELGNPLPEDLPESEVFRRGVMIIVEQPFGQRRQ